jgi:hypothetical protein
MAAMSGKGDGVGNGDATAVVIVAAAAGEVCAITEPGHPAAIKLQTPITAGPKSRQQMDSWVIRKLFSLGMAS